MSIVLKKLHFIFIKLLAEIFSSLEILISAMSFSVYKVAKQYLN